MTRDVAMVAAAARLAADLDDGAVVNLGRGLPGLVASVATVAERVLFQAENGLLGMGPLSAAGEGAGWLTDASKRPVTLMPGAAVFDLGASFDMIRGGRIDVAVLGAFQVSTDGDLASHAAPDRRFPPAVGGAMDLAACAKEVWVLMRHKAPDGTDKLVEQCTLPLTASGVVRRVYTELMTVELRPRERPRVRWQHPTQAVGFLERWQPVEDGSAPGRNDKRGPVL
jgi:3-oxoacid CoA-transferase B subunit